MSTQIFKKKININSLYELLDNIAFKSEKYYMFNNEAFKKGILQENIPKFLKECKEYYHNSKQKYLDRKLTYNSFTTILRQICKYNKITYTTQIKYDSSTYNIIYFIYFTA
jgi:tRNA G18 (ribose-2'-O)-methylase SpoU